ncbi:MAG: DUF305 domain-containing protein [Actinomycetota bacterium]|nr:DUF305 domain-containing protein [Actinomycetota bacterium]
MRNGILRLPILLAALMAAAAIIAGCGSSTSSPSAANSADRAFVQQMIPHHMMAVQMAQTAGQQGGHPQIKTLAASIISDQQVEIAQMTPIAQKLGVKPDAMPIGGQMSSGMMTDANTLGLSMNQMGMSMNMTSLGSAKPFDRAFIDMMIPHHQGAIRMAQAELAKGNNPKLRALARRIITAQDREIGEMNQWRAKWYGVASPAGGIPQAAASSRR